jgi:hypothetical protein
MQVILERERLPLVSPSGRHYGRHLHHDTRSWDYRVPRRGTLKSVRWQRHCPIFDQDIARIVDGVKIPPLGDCVANTAVGLMGTDPYFTAYAELAAQPYSLTDAGVVHAYEDITASDPFPGAYNPTDPNSQDTGSDGLSAAKQLKAIGAISGWLQAMGLQDTLSALQVAPCALGIFMYDSMEDPKSTGEMVIARGAKQVGGHEIILDELDVDNQRVWITNSWGTSWGQAGRAWMSYATLQRLLKEQGDVVQFAPLTGPAPKPAPTPAPTPTPGTTATAAQLWAALEQAAAALGIR